MLWETRLHLVLCWLGGGEKRGRTQDAGAAGTARQTEAAETATLPSTYEAPLPLRGVSGFSQNHGAHPVYLKGE